MEAPSEDCSVKVAVHIRLLVDDERFQGCKECLTVVEGTPQVQIGTHSFTFDNVFGGRGSPSTSMFEECITPLVDGLFHGYSGTVTVYGQILKEEVRDLLDSTSIRKSDSINGHVRKVTVPGKHLIQIREASDGVITLAGATEVGVSTLNDMVACLEQGSFSRATGSTNMNNQSSRSHAIFTITLEQMLKLQPYTGEAISNEVGEEYLCAKLHLVDLACSERAKRTGSDGCCFKEGIHINKGFLLLGMTSVYSDMRKRRKRDYMSLIGTVN